MKIVHLVIAGDVAGGQLVALQLLRAALSRGDEVLLVSPTPGPFVDLVQREGVRVELLDVNRLYRFVGAWRLARLLRRERATILHTHTALAANALSRIAGRFAGVAVVCHMHGINHFRPNRIARALYRAIDNRTARLCSTIVAVSEATRRTLEEQGYPRALLVTIHNGLAVEQLADRAPAVRSSTGVPEDGVLIGTVGRLCDQKGQRELIDAFGALAPSHAALWLVLVGEDLEAGGAYRRQLEKQARALGVAGRVVFTGYRDDVPALLRELDVFVLPSWIEGLPIVVLEAMAQEAPVVATDVGGIPELIDNDVTGVLVPPHEPAQLEAAIAQLLDDPPRRRRLAKAARERVVAEFSAKTMEDRVLRLYDAVAAGS